MISFKKTITVLSIITVLMLCMNCKSQDASKKTKITSDAIFPLSDPQNSGKWILNKEVSDEFDAPTLNEDKWYVVGKLENGKPVYKHPDFPNKKVWIGRAPSQFSGNNYRLENGKLMLETRWEPNFPFSQEPDKPWGKDNTRSKFENLTPLV